MELLFVSVPYPIGTLQTLFFYCVAVEVPTVSVVTAF